MHQTSSSVHEVTRSGPHHHDECQDPKDHLPVAADVLLSVSLSIKSSPANQATRRIEEGQHYEAHQQLRTIAARYVKQNNYDAAIDILFSGAQSLLKAAQGGSGGDLCLFLVEVYNTAETKPDSANRGMPGLNTQSGL